MTTPPDANTALAPSRFQVRVYYEDTDFSGHVYHAAYLKFFERARTEWLRERGFQHSELIATGSYFVARRMSISFDRPAHIDDLLDIETRITSASGARIMLEQALARAGTQLVSAEVEIVMLNASGRPTRLPAGLAGT